jgi:D-glycero-D-manno-heptose 1,7-bisphosphate phosphatase
MENMKILSGINSDWTLFLDRDGVINKRLINDYVKNLNEFEFLPCVKEAFSKFSRIFGKIIVVTNQRGIAKNLMTIEDLLIVNDYMKRQIELSGGRIDRIYFCPHDRDQNCGCRKPDIGLANKAKEEFSEIDFEKSIMIGDSNSDIEFGKKAGMITLKITTEPDEAMKIFSLKEFADVLESLNLSKIS